MKYGAIIITTGPFDKYRWERTLHEIGVDEVVVSSGNLLKAFKLGMGLLPDSCERIFVLTAESEVVHKETLFELMKTKADIVHLACLKSASCPLLISAKTARWCRLYNGKRGFKGAWESLVYIGEATYREVRLKENNARAVTFADPNYKPVINWI